MSWLHSMPLWVHSWQSSKFLSLPPLTPAPGAYVISALIEPPEWGVGGEFGPWGSHPHLTPVREHPRDPELQGSPEGETETQRGFPTCPALRRELRWGSSKRRLSGPLQYRLRMAPGGRSSGRLPCAPRGRVGRGQSRGSPETTGAQAGSVPCSTIAKSAQTLLLVNADKCQVYESPACRKMR